MNDETDPWARHRTLASDRGVGEAIVDAARYTSPEVYEAEREKIFRRTWLLVARATEVPNPGDFIKRTIYPLKAEAVIVRGKDGVIRAFHNVCAHRGTALVVPSEGTTNLFVCPYHAWSYGTDGLCKAIPGAQFFPQVDKSKVGLAPIHVDIWNGFVFLNFDQAPRQTLQEYLGEFGEIYGEIPFGEFTHALELTLDMETNWKCVRDANNEAYHVPFLHKKTLRGFSSEVNPLNISYDAHFLPPHSSLMAQTNPDWVPVGDVLKFVCAATGTTTFHPLDDPLNKPRMTKLSSYKAVNPIGMPHFSFRLLSVFPFTQLLLLDDSYVLVHYWPLGIDKTRFVNRFYFRSPPASYLHQFAQAHMVVSNRDVISEDSVVTRSQYRALKSGGMKQLHLGENELVIRYMHEMVQAYLNDRVPGLTQDPIASTTG
jgi:phenylpropionate dioxygenase-like ring-hydroxylating dioxygenase large terminal subunit